MAFQHIGEYVQTWGGGGGGGGGWCECGVEVGREHTPTYGFYQAGLSSERFSRCGVMEEGE